MKILLFSHGILVLTYDRCPEPAFFRDVGVAALVHLVLLVTIALLCTKWKLVTFNIDKVFFLGISSRMTFGRAD